MADSDNKSTDLETVAGIHLILQNKIKNYTENMIGAIKIVEY